VVLFQNSAEKFSITLLFGGNESAIRTQFWYTLIAQLLLTVIQKQNTPQNAFSTVAWIVRIHLIKYARFSANSKNSA